MKTFDKLKRSNLLDIIYHTILFTILSSIILHIIYLIPAWILKTLEENLYYTLIKGASWIIVSILVGLILGINYKKEELLKCNDDDMSSNILYMFLFMLIITIITGVIMVIGMSFVSKDVANYLSSLPTPSIGDYDSVFGKVIFIIALFIAAILNATGEELFIRYVTYHKLAKKNSGRVLNFKFIITTSLAFGLYHGVGFFVRLSRAAGVIRFLAAFTASVCICFVFLKTKSIIYAVIMHALLNFIPLSGLHLAVLSLFEKTVPTIGDKVYTEAISLLTIYLALIMAIWAYRYVKTFYRKTRK